jgi:hypothetical protein
MSTLIVAGFLVAGVIVLAVRGIRHVIMLDRQIARSYEHTNAILTRVRARQQALLDRANSPRSHSDMARTRTSEASRTQQSPEGEPLRQREGLE